MINCLQCYNLEKCGDVYFCAFAGSNPCIRGEHTEVCDPRPIDRRVKPWPSLEKLKIAAAKASEKERIAALKDKNLLKDRVFSVISDEVKATILRLREDNYTLKRITETTGVPLSTVRDFLRQSGVSTKFSSKWKSVKTPPPFKPYPKGCVTSYDWERLHTRIFEELAIRANVKEVAKLLKVSKPALHNYVRRYSEYLPKDNKEE